MEPLLIDGSQGEGGGQILRTSLSLSMLQKRPIRIINIRAGRRKPGLMRQHLMSVQAAATISNAKVKGDELGSQELFFAPGYIQHGRYEFKIGTAGSTTLVCQTLLPALLLADGASDILFEGGTHNGNSPSLTFLAESFLPLLKSLGVRYELDIEQYGFYPAGGGRWHLHIEPRVNLQTLNLTQTPKWEDVRIEAIVSEKLPQQIAEREISTVRRYLNLKGVSSKASVVKSPGPGNTVHISAFSHGVRSMIEVTGEKHLKAELVAKMAAAKFAAFQTSGALIEEHLADQLLLYMVMTNGGSFTTVTPSLHTTTNAGILELLTGWKFRITDMAGNFRISLA